MKKYRTWAGIDNAFAAGQLRAMKTLDTWLSEYAASHRHPVNRLLHKVCVPLIFCAIVGFFTIPRMGGSVWLSGAVLVSVPVLAFYLALGFEPFLQMLLSIAGCIGCCALLESTWANPWPVYATIFVAAWIGQFVGHLLEGARPSFFQDLQFLLIGPLWVFAGPGAHD